MDDDDLMQDIIATFLEEAARQLASIDVLLLAIASKSAPGDAPLRLFQLVHSIRGNAGLIGFQKIESVMDDAEDRLARVRDEGKPFDRQVISSVERAASQCAGLIEQVRREGTDGSTLDHTFGLGDGQ